MALYANDAERLAHGRRVIHMRARDHSRTLMLWNVSPNAGFCEANAKPGMRVMDDYRMVNGENQMKANDDNQPSTWQFWQRGLCDRKEHKEVFVYRDYQEFSPGDPSVFAYGRTSEIGERGLMILNFSGTKQKYQLAERLVTEFWGHSTCTKGRANKALGGSITLQWWDGVLGKCKT